MPGIPWVLVVLTSKKGWGIQEPINVMYCFWIKLVSFLITFFSPFPFWEYFFHWLIICASNSDLVPRESVEKWLKYLREEFPTVAFKCSTQQQKSNLGRSKKIKTSNTLQLSDCLGAETLLKLLKNYARSDKVTEDYFYVQCSCPLFLFFMFLFLWCLQVFL